MSAIQIGDTTIQRIVEQEDAFFDAFEFFPNLTQEMLDENRDWLYPVFFQPGGTKFALPSVDGRRTVRATLTARIMKRLHIYAAGKHVDAAQYWAKRSKASG